MSFGRINDLHERRNLYNRYVMCIFSFHLSDSFQELGISPNPGWIPSRPGGAEVPPRWQTLDGIKALSHRLALIHGSPSACCTVLVLRLPAGAGAAPEPTGASLWGHILPGSVLMELRNEYFEVWWGWQRNKAVCSKPNTAATEKYKLEKKAPLYSRQQKLLMLQRCICPWNCSHCYLFFGICLGLGYF